MVFARGDLMTIEELYGAIGGNYLDAKRRLMNDQLVTKFILKFPGDPTFAALVTAWEKDNTEEIFRAAHTLKGVCANLALNKLSEAASEIAEIFRPGNNSLCDRKVAEKWIEKLNQAYVDTIDHIKLFEKSLV